MIVTDLKIAMFRWEFAPWRTGVGQAFGGPLLEFLKPMVIGRNPLDIGAIWSQMWKQNRSVSTNAIGAVDVALWDIAGKAANRR